MPTLLIKCPECSKEHRLSESMFGRKFKCLGCSEILQADRSTDASQSQSDTGVQESIAQTSGRRRQRDPGRNRASAERHESSRARRTAGPSIPSGRAVEPSSQRRRRKDAVRRSGQRRRSRTTRESGNSYEETVTDSYSTPDAPIIISGPLPGMVPKSATRRESKSSASGESAFSSGGGNRTSSHGDSGGANTALVLLVAGGLTFVTLTALLISVLTGAPVAVGVGVLIAIASRLWGISIAVNEGHTAAIFFPFLMFRHRDLFKWPLILDLAAIVVVVLGFAAAAIGAVDPQ